MHKAVTQCVEAKKLLSRRRQSEYNLYSFAVIFFTFPTIWFQKVGGGIYLRGVFITNNIVHVSN